MPAQRTAAFFFQQGVTSWTDGHGLRRYDMRYGVVRRFNVSDEPGAQRRSACRHSSNKTWNTAMAGSSPAWTMMGPGGEGPSITFSRLPAGAMLGAGPAMKNAPWRAWN